METRRHEGPPPIPTPEHDAADTGAPWPPTLILALLIPLVAVVVLVAYWPVLSTTALSFDDTHYLTENPLVRNPSLSSAVRFLREVLRPSTVEGYYQPLSMISLMLDYARAAGPDDLRPFRVTSLALHVLNTSLIILLLYRLFRNPWIAALIGLLFGVHPLTLENVAWLGERKTLLAAFFSLVCLLFYVRYARRRRPGIYVACLAAYVLALMSKPTSTPLPLLMLLLDFWPLNRMATRRKNPPNATDDGRHRCPKFQALSPFSLVWEKAPFLLIGAGSAVITLVSQGQTAEVHLPGQYPLLRIVLMLCHNTVFYLWRLVWPVRASAFHPFPQPLTLASPGILAGIVGTLILILVLALSLRRTRALLAGWLFFFVAILPAMGVVGFTIVIAADRFVYLPVVGLLMVLASLLERVWNPSGPARFVGLRRAGLVALVAVLATAEIRGTRHYLGYWRDSETLCRYFIEGASHVPILHFNLAGVLASQRRYDEAAAAYREAIRLKSDYYEAYGGLATVLEKQGRLGEAMEQYREAIKGPPTRIKARILFNMGVALGKQGRTDEAIECYRQSLSIHRDDFAVHTNLGAMLLNQRRIDEAIEHFTAAAKINPTAAMPHRNLGMALTAQGRLGDAALAYRRALRIAPGDTAVRCELAAILTALGRFDEAIEEYRRVLAADPFHRLAQEGLQQAMSRRNKSAAP